MLIRHFFRQKVAPTVFKQYWHPSSCRIKDGPAPCLFSSAISSNKSNKLNKLASPEKLLVYEGPYSSRIRLFKMTGSMFAFCAVVAFPTLLWSANASPFLIFGASSSALAPLIYMHWLTRKYVTKLYVYDARRGVKKVNDDLRLIFETYNIFGRIAKVETFISKLEPGRSNSRQPETWIMKKPSRRFFLEPAIMQGDDYLHKISERISKNATLNQREPTVRKI